MRRILIGIDRFAVAFLLLILICEEMGETDEGFVLVHQSFEDRFR